MTDHDIDELVRGVAPTDDAVTSSSLVPVLAELREQIMETDTVRPSQQADASELDEARSRHRSQRAHQLVGAAAAAALLALVSVVVGVGDESNTAYAAEIVAVAERSPRLLIGADGWDVTRADELNAGQGEMTFENGPQSAELNWRPASTHAGWVEDRREGADLEEPIVIAGDDGVLFRYRDIDDRTALWLRGDHSLELRIRGVTEAEFRDIADELVAVDVNDWLDALPDSVVRPAERSDTVDAMLADLPIPDSFDPAVRDGAQTSDRYQLGVQVTGAVACAWLDQWVEAERTGDTARKAEAAEALATSPSWPILLEMIEQGAYPDVIWEWSAAVNGGELEVPTGVKIVEYGPEIVAERGYASALGCD